MATRRPLAGLACLLAAALNAPPVPAGLTRHDRERDPYRERGREPQFSCVGKLVVKGETPATGVLIAPRWVLTAAHAARRGRLEDQQWEFRGESYRPLRRVLHPSYRADRDAEVAANGWDLALVELQRPVENVQPAVRYRGCDEVGRVATMVVEGRRGDGVAGPDFPHVYERIAGENMIDAAGGRVGALEVSDHVLLWDFDHPQDASLSYLGDSKPLDLEIGGASGDSGGGMFIHQGGTWHLAGICSGGIPRSGDVDEPKPKHARTYGQIGSHVRVSTANEWVDEVIRGDQK